MTLVLVFKLVATLWVLGWFGLLGALMWKADASEIIPFFAGWALVVVAVHAALAVPVGLLLWIWL